MTTTEHYTEMVQQGQEAASSAVDAWLRAMKDAVGHLPGAPTQLDADQIVDQVFDFAERMLAVQRELAKNLVKTATGLAGSVGQRTRDTTRDTVESVSAEG